jgi:hypothetical protein
MTGHPTPQTDDLPAELAERLQQLADGQMSGSRPWPAVDNAIRRSHHRRLAGMSAAAACAVIIGVTFGNALGISSDRSQPAPPVGVPTATASSETLPGSGYAGPPGGSLAGDPAWLAQVRARVEELVDEGAANSRKTKIMNLDGDADDVQVAWTTDLDGHRYAFAMYPGAPAGSMDRVYIHVLLVGPAGAAADQLQISAGSGRMGGRPGTVHAAYETSEPGSDLPDLLLVAGPPSLTGVKLASGRKFKQDGTSATNWRSMQREGGAIWVARLTPGEAYLSELKMEQAPPDNGYASSNQHFPQLGKQAAAVAPAGSYRSTVEFAGAALSLLEPSIAEQAVLSTSRRVSKTSTLAATVFRSPDGVALVGFAEQDLKFKATSARRVQMARVIPPQPINDPATFMVAMSTRSKSTAGYLVLTPAGATQARIGTVTVPVHNRLARFERTSAGSAPVTVQALNAQGKVIGTVVSVKSK